MPFAVRNHRKRETVVPPFVTGLLAAVGAIAIAIGAILPGAGGFSLVSATPAQAQVQAAPAAASAQAKVQAATIEDRNPRTPPAAASRATPVEANATSGADTSLPLDRTAKVGTICKLIAREADSVGMNRDFFARLIWKESRFDAGAISPVGARGIAQFMPYTAAERGLDDPYDIEQAIHHSATYLRDLKGDLGNWGLAAAAYNGGINRVKRWAATGGILPYETENYVASITGRSADWFLEDGHTLEAKPLDDDLKFLDSCSKLPVMKTRALYASTGVDSAPMKPWGVQVAGNERQAIAMRMFSRVQSAYPSILGSIKPIVMRTRTSPMRRIYAVRVGADSRGEADAFCDKLRSAGGSCIVLKN